MKRRSFLSLLGIGPVAATLPAMAGPDSNAMLDGVIRASDLRDDAHHTDDTLLDVKCGAIRYGEYVEGRFVPNGVEIDIGAGVISFSA